jgi:hypothetical protein
MLQLLLIVPLLGAAAVYLGAAYIQPIGSGIVIFSEPWYCLIPLCDTAYWGGLLISSLVPVVPHDDKQSCHLIKAFSSNHPTLRQKGLVIKEKVVNF